MCLLSRCMSGLYLQFHSHLMKEEHDHCHRVTCFWTHLATCHIRIYALLMLLKAVCSPLIPDLHSLNNIDSGLQAWCWSYLPGSDGNRDLLIALGVFSDLSTGQTFRCLVGRCTHPDHQVLGQGHSSAIPAHLDVMAEGPKLKMSRVPLVYSADSVLVTQA